MTMNNNNTPYIMIDEQISHSPVLTNNNNGGRNGNRNDAGLMGLNGTGASSKS
jgi:hypothetical protein